MLALPSSRRPVLAAALVAGAVVLAGCGSSDSSAETAPSAAPADGAFPVTVESALGDAVNDISAGVAAAGNRLSDLKSDIAPMVATWEGSAQTAYYAQQAKWDNAWSELTAALGDFQRATSTAATGYESGERANTSAWG